MQVYQEPAALSSSASPVTRVRENTDTRHASLARLSRAGYGGVCYIAGEFYLTGPSGDGPRAATYGAAIDAAIKLIEGG